MKQLKQSLTGKLQVLSKLDDELIELVLDEQLEEEVEQADLIRERTTLALISLEDGLESLQLQKTPRNVASPSASPEASEDDRRSPHIPAFEGHEHPSDGHDAVAPADVIVPPTTDGIVPSTTVPSYSGPPPLITVSASPTIGGVAPSHPLVPLVSVGTLTGIPHTSRALAITTMPTLSTSLTFSGTPSLTSVSSGPPMPVSGFGSIPGTTLSHPLPLSPASHLALSATGVTTQVKLPKLSIKKFNGDLTRWVTFWDSFNSSIHTNPTLSSVDKFNYLSSLLESSAAEAIAGLTLTAANYDEAIATLKKRFGNPQFIVNKHMEALLNTPSVSSNDIKGLRRLYDSVEAHIRGLRALGISVTAYGSMLSSVLVNKLPPGIRLIVSREIAGDSWDVDRVMSIVEREVDARERVSVPTSCAPTTNVKPRRPIPTAATLLTSDSGLSGDQVLCVYCGQSHPSSSCSTIIDITVRKEILRKAGRCYTCLKRHHLSKNCRSRLRCESCRGRHHVTICSRNVGQSTDSAIPPPSAPNRVSSEGSQGSTPTTTNSFYASAGTHILLQTARLQLFNPHSVDVCTVARAILDSGSQRTYITSRLREELNLSTIRIELLQIKTFGRTGCDNTSCDVVRMGITTKNNEALAVIALVVPFICNPLTTQPIDASSENHSHLLGLELADTADASDMLEIDMLIGSDCYWSLVTGRIIKGESGPTAIHTKAGWVLSGPTDQPEVTTNLIFTTTHALKIETHSPLEENLDDHLKRFWELESLGVTVNETSVYNKFVQQVKYDGQRYEVSLPWKEHHPALPDHYDLCHKRLINLLRSLKQSPQLLRDYDAIIKDQVSKGIVEIVNKPSSPVMNGRVHYLPHHGVIRQDKSTSKLRIVYDASARSSGPSLNSCLYTGPKSGQSIFDILLRFRAQCIALTGDIEKAFLMVSVKKEDRDSLRFLWISNPNEEPPEITTLQFTRVTFGVSSSPFLLNATISHHMEQYRQSDPAFVDKFLSSIYVDDLVSGSRDIESTYELYKKAKLRLATAGFKLRKFVTNSEELSQRIQKNESFDGRANDEASHNEEDQSYAKSSLGVKAEDEPGTNKVLGVQWSVKGDELQFNIQDVTRAMEDLEPTKRDVASATARFFDPLGVISPVTILFKMFCQELCKARIGWDEALTGSLLEKWQYLLSMMKEAQVVTIPRCLYRDISVPLDSARLVGFCDASSKAYAAVVYVRLESGESVDIKFVAAKTRVAPAVGSMTIPRLELLSAVLLSKLIASVHSALESELQLDHAVCFTDSKVSLYWIQGVDHEWKQFVENRVNTIRELVPLQYWRHCPGKEILLTSPQEAQAPRYLVNLQFGCKALTGCVPRVVY